MNMQMIWRIEHFLLVIRHGSFNAAARAGGLTQPALSKSIKHLEFMVGIELVIRLPGGVVLSEVGEIFYKRALEIEASWSALLTELNVQSRDKSGQLHIGGGPVYSTVYFPDMLAGLMDAFPKLEVQVLTGSAAELLPVLKRGEILCYAGIVPGPEHGLERDFKTLPLCRQENAIYASKTHPILKKSRIAAEDLLDHLWLTLYSSLGAVSDIESYFHNLNLSTPHIALRAHSVQIALKMLIDHHYLACIPMTLAESLPNSELVRLDVNGFSSSIKTGVTFRKSAEDYATIEKVCDLLISLTSCRNGSHDHI